jgi:hypothetical protein
VKAWLKNARLLTFVGATVAVLACDEKLDSGMACPALCPQPPTTVRDTTLFAVELDTSIAGYPTLGTEVRMFIASMGDTLQTRGIVRFDSLPVVFRHNNTVVDSPIVYVDTGAYLRLPIATGDTLGDSITVELYDVDMDGQEETDLSVLAQAFTPARLIGSHTFPPDSMKDSLRVPIDPNVILAKVQRDSASRIRLRIGIRVIKPPSAASASASMSAFTSNSGFATQPILVFRPSADTTVPKAQLEPDSKTPDDIFIAADMADFVFIERSPPPPPADVLRVGSLPGRRAYLRFIIPASIIDSSSIVRATLQLTQRPNAYSPEATDSVALQPFEVTASSAIRDIDRALIFLRSVAGTSDSLRMIAADTGLRSVEMIGIVRGWRFTTPERAPRAIALRTSVEGISGRQLDFFSVEAPLEVRPRLRLTYLPRPREGLP